MNTRLTAVLAGVGLAMLAASPAFADGEGYDLLQTTADDLAQQFDAVAPHYKDSAVYSRAIRLRQQAGADIRDEAYQHAIERLRTALNDIRVYPDQ